MVRPLALLLVLFATQAADLTAAHPIHSTFAEVMRGRDGRLTISVRLFADDFGAVIDAIQASTRSTGEAAAKSYASGAVELRTRSGTRVPLQWCGVRTEGGLTWICLRSTVAVSGPMQLRNVLMFDRFADQINIVRWTTRSGTRTTLLTERRPDVSLD